MIERFKQYYKRTLNRVDEYPKACVYADRCTICGIEDGGRVLFATIRTPSTPEIDSPITPYGFNIELLAFCDTPHDYRPHWYITRYYDRENCTWYNDILCSRGCETLPQHIRMHFRELLDIKDIEKIKKLLVNYPLAKYVVEGIEKDIIGWDEKVLWGINNDTRTHFNIFTNYLKQGI